MPVLTSQLDPRSTEFKDNATYHRTLVEEHVFVPASASAREGEGWLIGTVFDVDAGCTRLTAFDAQHVAAGPVATASLNGVAPLGLHGLFRAA